MFDVGWTEMLVIAIVMIVVVGPKDLPKMLRTFGRTTSKLRAMAGDFRKQFDEALKEAELDDVKNLVNDVRKLNPTNEIKQALNPMQKAAADVRAGLDAAFNPKPATPPAAAAAAVAADKAAAETPVPAEVPAASPPPELATPPSDFFPPAVDAPPAPAAKPAETPAPAAAAAEPAKSASAPRARAKAPAKAAAAAAKPKAAPKKAAPRGETA